MKPESQELHCHNCNQYVRFTLDLSLNGNYVLDCPKCNHKHYRTVKDGKILDARWGQDPSQGQYPVNNGNWITIQSAGTSVLSMFATSGSTNDIYLHGAWNDFGTGTATS